MSGSGSDLTMTGISGVTWVDDNGVTYHRTIVDGEIVDRVVDDE